ncbi:unnamed protein product, partial [Mesorhabditis belari]|uniref:Uncharacterized protein n=1 Tax=Mesorhabditis belari TaxID=2138241 RepID=A0AAF3ERI9_9BILA
MSEHVNGGIFPAPRNEYNEAFFNMQDISISFEQDSFIEAMEDEVYEDDCKSFEFIMEIEEDRSAKVTLKVTRKGAKIDTIDIVIVISKDLLKKSGHLFVVKREDFRKFKKQESERFLVGEAAQGLMNLSKIEESLPKTEKAKAPQPDLCRNCKMAMNSTALPISFPTFPVNFPQVFNLKPPIRPAIPTSSAKVRRKIETFHQLPKHPDEIPLLIDKKSAVRDEQGQLLDEYRSTEWKSEEWAKEKLCNFSLSTPPPPSLLYQKKSCGANRKEQNELNPYELTNEDYSQISNGTLATSIRVALNHYTKNKTADNSIAVWKAIMDRVVNLRQSNKHKREKWQKEKWFTATVAVFSSHFLLLREVFQEVTIGLKQPIEMVNVLREIEAACHENTTEYDDRIKKIVEYAQEEAGRRPKKRAVHVKGESPYPDEPKDDVEEEKDEKESVKKILQQMAPLIKDKPP